MRLSDRSKHLLRVNGFSAVYVIGASEPVHYATADQVDALEQFIINPAARHNRQPGLGEFITCRLPVKIGATANPADNMVSVADGYSFEWKFSLLARVWFVSKFAADKVVDIIQASASPMRKSWFDLKAYGGREMLEFEIKMLAQSAGYLGLDDLELAETLEELWYQQTRKEMGI